MIAPPESFDPTDVATLRERLIGTLRQQFPGLDVAHGPAVISGGMDTYVYDVRLLGPLPPEWLAPLVLRIFPSTSQVEKAEREAAIQSFVASNGFPAPRVLRVDPTGGAIGLPYMIMAHASGVRAIELIKNPLKLPGMIRGMADLQVRLHRLPIESCPLPRESPLIDRLLVEPRGYVARFDPPGLRPVLDWLEAKADLVRDETPALLHLDFHPLNILVDGKHMTLIDWSDAAVGDRHADVARTLALFWLAAPMLQNAGEDAAGRAASLPGACVQACLLQAVAA